VGEIAPLELILMDKGAIGRRNNTKGWKCSTTYRSMS